MNGFVFYTHTHTHTHTHNRLTAKLDVTQSYIEIMAPFARQALLQAEGYADKQEIVSGEDALGGIKEVVQELVDSGLVLGCQVCVYISMC
jgi:hypothetical protein